MAALVLLGFLAVTLTAAIQSYNLLGLAVNGKAPMELGEYLGLASASPWTDGIWVTAMLLTTLIPTFCHLVLPLGSAVVFVTPHRWLAEDARSLEDHGDNPEIRATVAWHQLYYWLASALARPGPVRRCPRRHHRNRRADFADALLPGHRDHSDHGRVSRFPNRIDARPATRHAGHRQIPSTAMMASGPMAITVA